MIQSKSAVEQIKGSTLAHSSEICVVKIHHVSYKRLTQKQLSTRFTREKKTTKLTFFFKIVV